MFHLILILMALIINSSALAEDIKPLIGSVSDPVVEAQEKLMHAKGSYKTIKEQERAIKDMRKATKLSLKAASLRAKAEKLQTKADVLVNKANQTALSRGLYITKPMAPVMMQPPPEANPTSAQVEAPPENVQSAQKPTFVPLPGQPINIIIPKQEEVSYQSDSYLPTPPTVSNY